MTLINASTLLSIGSVVVGADASDVLVTDANGALAATNTPVVKKLTAGTDYTNGEGIQGTFILPNGISFIGIDKDGGLYQIISTDINNTLVLRNAFPTGDMVFGLGHASNTLGAMIIQLGGVQIGTIAGPLSPYYPAGISLANGFGFAPLTLGYREISGATTMTDIDVVIRVTSGTFAIAMLSVTGRKGREIIVKNSGAGTVTITPNGAETTETATIAGVGVARLIAGTTGWVAL